MTLYDGWMDGWMDGWVDGWIDGWMDEWMKRWMNGLYVELSREQYYLVNSYNKA